MREYKRKGQAEEMSSDLPCKKIKKHLESSERWRGKREITKEVDKFGDSRLKRGTARDRSED